MVWNLVNASQRPTILIRRLVNCVASCPAKEIHAKAHSFGMNRRMMCPICTLNREHHATTTTGMTIFWNVCKHRAYGDSLNLIISFPLFFFACLLSGMFSYCDVFQKCREVDPSGPLATLRRLLLSEESIASFKKWIISNWYTVAMVVIAVIVLLVSMHYAHLVFV